MNPLEAGLRQPDARSCGAASMVMAEMLLDATYGARVADAATFAREVLTRHRRLTAARSASGSWRLPWPRALGTPPWAVARELSELTGVRHRTHVVRWRRAPRVDVVPAALYVGSRGLPRHVVLAVATEPLRVYDPARGQVATVSAGQLSSRRLRIAGWSTAWFVVAPAGSSSGPGDSRSAAALQGP